MQEVIPDALLIEGLALDDVEVMEFFMMLENEFGKPNLLNTRKCILAGVCRDEFDCRVISKYFYF